MQFHLKVTTLFSSLSKFSLYCHMCVMHIFISCVLDLESMCFIIVVHVFQTCSVFQSKLLISTFQNLDPSACSLSTWLILYSHFLPKNIAIILSLYAFVTLFFLCQLQSYHMCITSTKTFQVQQFLAYQLQSCALHLSSLFESISFWQCCHWAFPMILGTCFFFHVHFTPLTPNVSFNQSPRPIDINRAVLDLAKI